MGMVRRSGLGGTALLLALACGARTIDYGDYGDYPFGEGSGGAAGSGSSKAGSSSRGGSSPIGKGGGGPIPVGGSNVGGRPGGAGGGPHPPTAGAPNDCPPPPPPSPNIPLIDNMEDGDLFIPTYEGRSGSWYAYNDTTSSQIGPVMVTLFPEREQSLYAVFTSGSGFSSWGAGIGLVLNGQCPFNAAKYQGISFYAWAGNAVDVPVRFNINTAEVTPVENGGVCRASCWDSHGIEITIIDDWRFFEIPFWELSQLGFGPSVPFNPSQLMAVQFQIPAYQDFELWIDDVSFY